MTCVRELYVLCIRCVVIYASETQIVNIKEFDIRKMYDVIKDNMRYMY